MDDEKQVIVACDTAQAPTDMCQMEPMLQKMSHNLQGDMPKTLTADAGYYSRDNCEQVKRAGVDPLVATGRVSPARPLPAAPRGRIPKNATAKERMARKLRTKKGRELYAKRKQTVEPVFGQIKDARGFRRFSFRGLEKVKAEWDLVCLTHNLLKLFRFAWVSAPA